MALQNASLIELSWSWRCVLKSAVAKVVNSAQFIFSAASAVLNVLLNIEQHVHESGQVMRVPIRWFFNNQAASYFVAPNATISTLIRSVARDSSAGEEDL